MVDEKPAATSTPYHRAGRPSILKEKQFNNFLQSSRKNQREKKVSVNPVLSTSTPAKAKENILKQKRGPTPSRYVPLDEKTEIKRRQQAIEAMKIQEIRRQRMSEPIMVEELERIMMKSATEVIDDISEKKRLEAKKSKEKRILAFLAEQEARKKGESGAGTGKERTVRFPTKSRFTRCLFKPLKESIVKVLPKVVEEEEMKTIPDKLQPTSSVFIPMKSQAFRKTYYVYSKEELRALNPYGFYFM